MNRIQIQIPDPLYEKLKNLEEDIGLTTSEIARRGIINAINEIRGEIDEY